MNEQDLSEILIFKIQNIKYAIYTKYLSEIYSKTNIKKVPRQKKQISGIINKRGEIETIIDLRMIIEGVNIIDQNRNCFIGIKNQDRRFSCEVNEVIEIVDIDKSKLKKNKDTKDCISGFIEIDNSLVSIFDYDYLDDLLFGSGGELYE